jgi:biotin carboxyl carrier protein
MKYTVNGQGWEPSRDDSAEVVRLSDRLFVRSKDGDATALVVRSAGKTYVSYRGRTYKIERAGRARHSGATDGGGEARAPMPGQIVEVGVSEGDNVQLGDRLMVLEAMKMQQPIVAPIGGTVRTVHVAKGDQVAEGQVLALVEAE